MKDEKTIMIGQSPELQALLRSAALVAATEATVLIQGESGTGKELLAHFIHQQGRRRQAPFVAVNCAAMPEGLAEAELFGHLRGAFTGAHAHRTGRITAAHGGTLFLDEVGEMPLSVQAKLLRFLESGECQVVGSEHSPRVDARIIAATNADIETKVRQGLFRGDLYYRLRVVPLQIPSLQQRQGDIERLLVHFIQESSRAHGLTPPRFTRASLRYLLTHPWPGNVRELRNFCERMVILHPGAEILPDDLPPEFHTPSAVTLDSPLLAVAAGGAGLEEVERRMICEALDKSGGNRTHAARLLHITRDTLLYRMKKFGLRP